MDQVQRENLRRALSGLTADQTRLAERFLAEMEFAEGLLRLHPAQKARWRKPIAQAGQAVEAVASAGRLDQLAQAVARAEQALAPIGKVAKTYTVHCVGHAHIDMNWMWSWPETVAVTNDTFLTVDRLMEEFDDFCFTQSQASVYAILRDYCPELLERVRRRIAEGRWEVAAVHWVEGDKNMAAGESLARHLLYTRRFMAEQFDLTPKDVLLDWEPDTFGHAATIPTILARGGVRRYYFCRGGQFEKPPIFWWRGPDGSRILVNRETTWYNDHLGPHNAAALLSFCQKTHLRDWMCVYGVGDHGGGPTRHDIHRCHEMNSWPIYPSFRLATTAVFYEVLEKHADWPELSGELNFEFTGCYTSQSRIKRTNRLAENLLPSAESAAVLAWRGGLREYPAERLREAWTDALFTHFHDILPGSGVQETREYQVGQFQRTAATTMAVTTHSLRALAGAIDTSALAARGEAAKEDAGAAMGAGVGRGTTWGATSDVAHVARGGRVFVAFNPTAWPRRETVRLAAWDAGDRAVNEQAFVARMPDGSAVPAQRLGSGIHYWEHRYVDLAVPLTVPALGYASFALDPAGRHLPGPSHGYHASVVGAISDIAHEPGVRFTGPLAMENQHVSVRLDAETGGIVELIDRATGVNLADPADPAGLLEYVLERPGGMSAWTIHEPQRRLFPLEVHSVRRTADGPHVAAIEATIKLNDSTLTLTTTLQAGHRAVEIHIEADWLERGSPEIGTPSLRFRVPLALRSAVGRYEIPFGSIERKLSAGEEVPALRWADVTGKTAAGKTAGCALLNDCKHGHSLTGSILRLSLIRSSYSPDPLPEIGHHTIRLGLVPHGGPLAPAELIRMGAAFNQPLRVISTDAHEGKLPPAAAAVRQVRPGSVVLTGVKKLEDDDAVVFRLQETAGRAADARVSLDAALLGKVATAAEVDLLERPSKPSAAKATGDGFAVKLPAGGIASVRVTFRR